MKKTVAYILTLVLLVSAVLPVSAAAIEPAWSKAGMKKETILLQPMEKPAEVPAAAEIAAETLPAETAEYTAPQLNAENAAKTGESLSGQCGENIHWVLNGTVLTISGTGIVKEEHFDEIWKVADGIATEVVIEPGITDIWNKVFRDRQGITKVTLADTVVYLGSSCFSECSDLSEVKLSSALTGIPQACFMGTNLSEITLPEGVTYINGSAFSQCVSLESVVIPDSVTHIGDFCFSGCEKLKTVRLSRNIKELPDQVFSCTGLESLEIPNSVQSLGSNPFYSCTNLKKLVIPPGVGYLGDAGITDYGDLTIYGWENTAAHIYAVQNGISFELMPEPAEGELYPVYLQSNQLGTARVSTQSTYAGSTVVAEAIPESDNVMPFIEVYYFAEEELDIQLEQIGDTSIKFRMPPCEVLVKVLFLDLNNPFWDVTENDYFLVPVLWARSMGITSGTSENTFSPNDPCTRGQVVTFLWRAAGEPKPESSENPFWDVHPGDYYYDAVLWAVENGITNGVRPGEFAPNDSCTRGQIVTFLWRAMGSPEPIEYGHTFADLDASQYYYNPVLWAVEYGVTNGTSETTFSPMDICTRGQIVTFLFRTLG